MNIIINDMINLRKSILGLVALVVVFGLVFTVSAFKTSNVPNRTTTTFYYDGPIPAEKGDVEDITNWKYDAGGQDCGTPQDEQACTITVSNDFVDDSQEELVLDPSINLLGADHGSLPAAYVTASADGTMLISNRYY
ncbi:MAG: hypothetical protein EOP54_06585 [Sphingobacteriales bacterium]|nr:MAG: hypothetical protein EOP54_06585 [Sphingobacteriales bacterium]